MKQFRKILGFILSLVFVFTLSLANPVESKASNYTYTVKIVLGGSGDEGAYFNSDLGVSVPATAKVEMIDNNSCVKISNLQFDDEVTIDPSTMVKIKPQTKLDDEGNEVQFSKYYVKGLRMSGMDTVLHKNSFKVEYDETFVVAYGVGDVVPYVVNYVNKNHEAGDSANTFAKPEDGSKYTVDSITCYAPANEELYVAYRNIPGYTPNTYNYHTKSLNSSAANPFEFTFYYTKGNGTVVNESTTEVITSSTETGDAEYSYETVSRETQHRQGGVTNTGNAGNGGANANNADNDNAGDGDEANQAGDDTTTIEDEETPKDVIDIDDEEVAKTGGAKERFVRNMIIGIIIAIIAVVSILVALYVAEKKRKKEIVKTQIDKKEE